VFSPKDSTKRSLITGLSQPDDIKLHPQDLLVRNSLQRKKKNKRKNNGIKT
jgi:hypothetical protein